jgi:hypothetical protein
MTTLSSGIIGASTHPSDQKVAPKVFPETESYTLKGFVHFGQVTRHGIGGSIFTPVGTSDTGVVYRSWAGLLVLLPFPSIQRSG